MKQFTKKTIKDTKAFVVAPYINYLVRIGYVVRGVLYGLFGVFTLTIFIISTQRSPEIEEIIFASTNLPLGKEILALIVIGLTGYSLWGLIRSSMDWLGLVNKPLSPIARLGYLVSGISYGALLYPALLLLFGKYSDPNSHQLSMIIGQVLTYPGGRILIFLAGVVGIGGGIWQFLQSWQKDIEKKVNIDPKYRDHLPFFESITRFGIAARAIVFALMGFYIVLAAIQLNPAEVKNFGESLDSLYYKPGGGFILFVISLGLVSFGIYSAVMSRFVDYPEE